MKTKTTIGLFLVLLYAVALLKPALPLVDYFIKFNDYKQRCINRSRPEMHCNGQCILMQKIMALEGDDADATPPAPVKVDLQEYPVGLISLAPMGFASVGTVVTWRNRPVFFTYAAFSRDIFHPPAPLKTA